MRVPVIYEWSKPNNDNGIAKNTTTPTNRLYYLEQPLDGSIDNMHGCHLCLCVYAHCTAHIHRYTNRNSESRTFDGTEINSWSVFLVLRCVIANDCVKCWCSQALWLHARHSLVSVFALQLCALCVCWALRKSTLCITFNLLYRLCGSWKCVRKPHKAAPMRTRDRMWIQSHVFNNPLHRIRLFALWCFPPLRTPSVARCKTRWFSFINLIRAASSEITCGRWICSTANSTISQIHSAGQSNGNGFDWIRMQGTEK